MDLSNREFLLAMRHTFVYFRVVFSENQVVLLDGYPRRTERSINFRFFVVMPHDAVPQDKDLLKPLLSRAVLAGTSYKVKALR